MKKSPVEALADAMDGIVEPDGWYGSFDRHAAVLIEALEAQASGWCGAGTAVRRCRPQPCGHCGNAA